MIITKSKKKWIKILSVILICQSLTSCIAAAAAGGAAGGYYFNKHYKIEKKHTHQTNQN